MRRLIREFARLSINQWLMLISLLVLLNMVVMGGMVFLLASDVSPESVTLRQMVLAYAPSTSTPLPTFTPAPPTPTGTTPTPLPSSTSTIVPTWTPSITPTPGPTHTPTITPTPLPTDTPVAVVAQVRRPSPPTATPTPNVDFVVDVRQLTACENQGKHHLFIYVLDQQGQGMPGMPVRVSWVGGEAQLVTGQKEHPGHVDFAMFKGRYQVELPGILSQKTGDITPDIPQDVPCPETGNTVANSLYHYSYEVTFRKVR